MRGTKEGWERGRCGALSALRSPGAGMQVAWRVGNGSSMLADGGESANDVKFRR